MTEERGFRILFIWKHNGGDGVRKRLPKPYFRDKAMEAIFNASLCVLQPAKNPET